MTYPDPDIVGLYQGVLGDQHGIVKPEAAVQAESPPVSGGPSLAQQRKAISALQRPCTYGLEQSPACQVGYRSPACCGKVLARQCEPPREVRVAFGKGYDGKIAEPHLIIASGSYRDAKDGC